MELEFKKLQEVTFDFGETKRHAWMYFVRLPIGEFYFAQHEEQGLEITEKIFRSSEKANAYFNKMVRKISNDFFFINNCPIISPIIPWLNSW